MNCIKKKYAAFLMFFSTLALVGADAIIFTNEREGFKPDDTKHLRIPVRSDACMHVILTPKPAFFDLLRNDKTADYMSLLTVYSVSSPQAGSLGRSNKPIITEVYEWYFQDYTEYNKTASRDEKQPPIVLNVRCSKKSNSNHRYYAIFARIVEKTKTSLRQDKAKYKTISMDDLFDIGKISTVADCDDLNAESPVDIQVEHADRSHEDDQ